MIASFVVDVCGSLSKAVVVNWGPVVRPESLGANLSILHALPEWLSARISGANIITFTSEMVPASASSLNISLSITQTCRSSPWVGVVMFEFVRSDPVFIRDSSSKGSDVQSCPDFSLRYMALLGTCTSQTIVTASLSNGSALPSFVSFSFTNGMLEIAGTLPLGTAPISVIAVALLGQETFFSLPTTVTLVQSVPLQISVPASNLQACPYISISFSITSVGGCGRMKVWALLANGSALPSFLSTGIIGSAVVGSTTTLIVFGTVPEKYPEIDVIASVTTGGDVFNSSVVKVARPPLVSTANASIRVQSGADNATFVSSEESLPLQLSALYGIPLHAAVTIDAGAGPICSSISLQASSSSSTAASADNNGATPPTLRLPVWASVTVVSPNVVIVIANPTTDVPRGTRMTLHVWIKDGFRNPGFNITIVTEMSLRLLSTNHIILPQVQTPASLLQMQADVLSSSAPVVLICPASAVLGFCSVGADGLSIGVFGTPTGVNAILRGLSVLLPSDRSVNASNITVQLSFKEAVNPDALLVQVPLAALREYKGVRQVKPLDLFGKVGKDLAQPITDFFNVDSDAAAVTYKVMSNATWLTIENGFIKGTPPSPPIVMLWTVLCSDKFTEVTASGKVNISWPMWPVVNPTGLRQWSLSSSSPLDVQLPPDIIVDPENGTIVFDLQQYTGSANMQPLPIFLMFDAKNLRMSGMPQAADVGMYALILTGTSHWGQWQGNVTVLLTISVDQSWGDFFAWVYSIVGYCASAIGVVTWVFVYRALVMNTLLFSRRMRTRTPEDLCRTGHYTLQHVVDVAEPPYPIPTEWIQAVQITLIEKQVTSSLKPAYFVMQSRLSGEVLKEDMITGLLWMRVNPTRAKTVELVVDIPALQIAVANGNVQSRDEFLVEVISRGLWSSGTVIEAFTFTVSDLVGLVLANPAAGERPKTNVTTVMLSEDEPLDARVPLSEREHDEVVVGLLELPRVDPYTGECGFTLCDETKQIQSVPHLEL